MAFDINDLFDQWDELSTVHLWVSVPVNVSLGLEIVDDILPWAGHDEAGQVCLHTDDLDVDAVPWNGLKHL